MERGGAVPTEPQDRMQALRAQAAGVKDVMAENVNRNTARGEKMDDLMDQSEDLQGGAQGEAVPRQPQNRLQALQAEVDGVKDVLTQNVDRLVARGERLDNLMDRSEDLQATEPLFKTCQKVARSYCWKNLKLVLVLVVIVILIIALIIILLATGVIPKL